MKKETIRNSLKVFAVGGVSTLLSAAAGALVYAAVRIFGSIPAISGYHAVLAFAVGLLAVAVALAFVYICGAWVVNKGKFAR